MYKDFIYAIRLLKKNPGFSILTMTVMSVGLGLAIFMFAMVNMLAYKDLDLTDYDRLVVIDATVDGFEQNGGSIYPYDYHYFADRQQSYEEFGAYTSFTANLSDGARAQRYSGAILDPVAFKLLDGNKNILKGRSFTEEDTFDGAEEVMIISYKIWQEVFGGDENIIGKTANLSGDVTKIVGVVNQGYTYPMNQDVWAPLNVSKTAKPGQGWVVSVLARLKPGVTMEQAQLELAGYAKEIANLSPETNGTIGVNSRSMVKMMMDNSMPIIYVLIGATFFILTLVVANVGNLMLARASERSKEFAIRSALGAPKFRIVRQMMFETLLICLVGGVFGIIIAGWGLDLSKPMFYKMGGWVAPWWSFSLGQDELVAALWIILGTAFFTGIVPAMKSSDSDINAVLRDGTRGALGKKEGRLSKILVTAEVFLSCAVLIVAGALIIAVNKATNADYGADVSSIYTARFSLTSNEYVDMAKRYEFHQKLITQLESQPGVRDVTVASAFPGRNSGREAIKIEGFETVPGQTPRALFQTVDASYHELLDIPLVEGRYFDGRDARGTQRTTIITDTFAKKFWPNESAIGKRIKADPTNENSEWLTIIGVVEHVVHQQPFGDAYSVPAMYVTNAQFAYRTQFVALKVDGDPYQYQQMLMDVAGQIDPNFPMFNGLPLDERIARRVLGIQFVGNLFIIFGALALLLASAGIYGVMSQNVTRRTQELGVRRALGATESVIYRMLIKQSSILLTIGVILGGALGYLGIQLVSGALMQLGQYYPLVASVVVAVIAVTTAIATIIPAQKSMDLEPNNALRYE